MYILNIENVIQKAMVKYLKEFIFKNYYKRIVLPKKTFIIY